MATSQNQLINQLGGGNSQRKGSKDMERSKGDINEERKEPIRSRGRSESGDQIVKMSGKGNTSLDEKSQQKSQSQDELMQEEEEIIEKPKAKWMIRTDQFLEHWATAIFMTSITVYSLFFDDIRAAAVTSTHDPVFYIITIICMFCFLLEILLASIVKDDYFLSFFFWLDLVSTISMIGDIGWITNGGGGKSSGNVSSLAKTSRASRVTRVIRIVRLIRLIRIVKLYKQAKLAQSKQEERTKKKQNLQRKQPLSKPIPNVAMVGEANAGSNQDKYKAINEQKTQKIHPLQGDLVKEEQKQENKEDSFDKEVNQIDQKEKESVRQSIDHHDNKKVVISHGVDDEVGEGEKSKNNASSIAQDSKIEVAKTEEDNDEELILESNISKTLTERTTKIVIILVLTLLFILPLFQDSTWFSVPIQQQAGLKLLVDIYSNGSWETFQFARSTYIAQNAYIQYPLVYLITPNTSMSVKNNLNLTWEPYPPVFNTLRAEEISTATYTSVDGFQFIAVWSIFQENKIQAIMSICRTIFVCIVLTIASIYFTEDANTLVLGPIERMLEKVKLIAKDPLKAASDEVETAGMLSMMHQQQIKKSKDQEKEEAQYETAALEKAIIKIGHLLALGFGEAGSKIIASNLSAGGDLNPMMSGQRTYAIFGFCDIRNFTDSTEILQTKVMLFVNQIAEITHSQVDKYGGSANKNIGDAFLLVWKFKNMNDFTNPSQPLKVSTENAYLADLAMFSFIKIIAKINKLSHILDYRNDEGLNARMPGYKVKMGFGLHQGWAIEGAIGSFFKIDASYLSPNVNMASRLEAATKQYGVPLLVSGALHDIFTEEIKLLCREIDTVTVKGSVQPMRLFTIDLDFDNLEEKQDRFLNMAIKDKKKIREQEKKILHQKLNRGKKTTWDIYSRDKDFKELRRNYDKMLHKKFSEAYKKYIAGDWATAEDLFSQCLKINPKDGPTLTLKNYIEELNGIPPAKWNGFRELTEK